MVRDDERDLQQARVEDRRDDKEAGRDRVYQAGLALAQPSERAEANVERELHLCHSEREVEAAELGRRDAHKEKKKAPRTCL